MKQKRENKVNETKMEQKQKVEKYRQQLKLSLDEDPSRTFDLSPWITSPLGFSFTLRDSVFFIPVPDIEKPYALTDITKRASAEITKAS